MMCPGGTRDSVRYPSNVERKWKGIGNDRRKHLMSGTGRRIFGRSRAAVTERRDKKVGQFRERMVERQLRAKGTTEDRKYPVIKTCGQYISRPRNSRPPRGLDDHAGVPRRIPIVGDSAVTTRRWVSIASGNNDQSLSVFSEAGRF